MAKIVQATTRMLLFASLLIFLFAGIAFASDDKGVCTGTMSSSDCSGVPADECARVAEIGCYSSGGCRQVTGISGTCCDALTGASSCDYDSCDDDVTSGVDIINCEWTPYVCAGTAVSGSQCLDITNVSGDVCSAFGCGFASYGQTCYGNPCLGTSDCCELFPYCIVNEFGTGSCARCIPIGYSTPACTESGECCGSAVCDLTVGSPTYQECIFLPPPAVNHHAPNALSASPQLNVSVLNSTQGVSCSNCGSIPIPTDPDNPGAGQTVHLEFRWYKNATAIGGWGTSAADFSCAANSCVSGDLITLSAKACDNGSPVKCSSEAISSPALVQDFAVVGSVCQSDKFNNVVSLAGIAAIGMGCIIALAYMLGEFLQNPRLLTWAKAEAGQVVLSAAIVVVLLWALSVMCTMRVGEVGALAGIGSVPKIYDSAQKSALPLFSGAMLYLENLAGASLSNLAALRYNLGAYEIRTSFSEYTCDPTCLFSLSSVNEAKFGGETMHLAITNNLLGVGTASYLSVLFQYFTLTYIANGLFVQFLPLAIIIRSIPFMRHFGGALIAIFVALYILYPAMIVADAYIAPAFTHYAEPITAYDRGGGCRGLQDTFYSPSGGVSCISKTASCGFLGLGSCKVEESTVQNIVTLWEAKDSLDDIKPGDLAQSVRLNVLIFLTAVFLPAVNFIVIAAFARDLSRFLGEEADITRLGQMV